MRPQLAPLHRALEIVGSQHKLVEAIGRIRSQAQISRMVLGQAPMSPDVAKAIEAATDFQVRRWELLPDVWDPPSHLRAHAPSASRARASR